MARKRKDAELIRGRVAHRRTEGDYMGVLLGAVTLEDWRDVVNGAKTAAKAGDPQARAWLAQYLMGRPEGKAPTPLNIVVQQLNGSDPLVEKTGEAADRPRKVPQHARERRLGGPDSGAGGRRTGEQGAGSGNHRKPSNGAASRRIGRLMGFGTSLMVSENL
jgi:hypothetical protein